MKANLRRIALAIVAVTGLGGNAAFAQSSIIGTWTGVLEQRPAGTQSSYAAELTFTSPTSGTSRYPSLNCSGTLSGGGSAGTYRFRESIREGRATPTSDGCIDGSLEINLNGQSMSVRWTGSFEGTSYAATGTLRLVKLARTFVLTGAGTIGGFGGFAFKASFVETSPDRFREVVEFAYDNPAYGTSTFVKEGVSIASIQGGRLSIHATDIPLNNPKFQRLAFLIHTLTLTLKPDGTFEGVAQVPAVPLGIGVLNFDGTYTVKSSQP